MKKMDTLKDKKIKFFEETENSIAHFTANGDECAALYRINKNVARRLCAAWNYCEGVPTDELESPGANEAYWGRSDVGLSKENKSLREENARLRAAVLEMERMLPVLYNLEKHNPGTWSDLTDGTGIATANAYRQTLETALAKIESK